MFLVFIYKLSVMEILFIEILGIISCHSDVDIPMPVYFMLNHSLESEFLDF